FEQLGKAWQEKEDLFGQTLNHLAGFRLEKYKHRGWDDVLKEPLDINRMTKETLNAMWGAISDNKRSFVTFLEKKAELLGLDRLSMYDVNAPLTQSVKTSTYTEGAEFIIDHFRSFSPKMAARRPCPAVDLLAVAASNEGSRRRGLVYEALPA